jgi:hypothetical protein
MYQLVSKYLLFVLLISCSTKPRKEQIINYDNIYYERVVDFLKIYDTDEDMKLYIEGTAYHIEDSLSKYLSKINIDSLYNDEKFEAIMGNLLEKRYLSLTKIIPKQYVTRSLTYNARAWCYLRKSSQSFLNYLWGIEKGPDIKYEEYSLRIKDFMCIDSVILKLNENIYLKNDSIHKDCMKLVEQKKTGGCLW